MSWFKVYLAVARGACFDTGHRLETKVLATDRLDAALKAEAEADRHLENPGIEYTHAKDVILLGCVTPAMALAA